MYICVCVCVCVYLVRTLINKFPYNTCLIRRMFGKINQRLCTFSHENAFIMYFIHFTGLLHAFWEVDKSVILSVCKPCKKFIHPC